MTTSQTRIQSSSIVPNRTVDIDPFGLNPLIEDLKQASPTAHRIAHSKSTPPRMFTGGAEDLPAITASGTDPKLLRKLPFTARHRAAAEPSTAAVAALLEDPEGAAFLPPHQGFLDAISRVQDWASGRV